MVAEANRLFDSGSYAKALFLYKELIPIWAYDNRQPAMAAFCYLMMKDVKNADKYINIAKLINQSDYLNYIVDS